MASNNVEDSHDGAELPHDHDGALQIAMTHWIHEDNLYWAQIRYLLAIQLAGIVAWYFLRAKILSILVMTLIFAVTVALFFLANQIQKNRDVNANWIREQCKKSYLEFEFATHPLGGARDAGVLFHYCVFMLSLFIDIFLWFAAFDNVAGPYFFVQRIDPHFK